MTIAFRRTIAPGAAAWLIGTATAAANAPDKLIQLKSPVAVRVAEAPEALSPALPTQVSNPAVMPPLLGVVAVQAPAEFPNTTPP